MKVNSLHGITCNKPHGWNPGNFYMDGYTGTVTSRDYKDARMVIVENGYESTYEEREFVIGESNGMKVNSFFCGAGGFDLGFIQAGFEITGAWDFDKYAVESYNHNIGGAEQADVSLMKGADIPKANGWLFGFPCQDISVAGKQKGMLMKCTSEDCGHEWEPFTLLDPVDGNREWGNDCPECGTLSKPSTRSGLFYEIMRLLGEVSDKPEWILAENVKAVKKLIPVIEKEYDKAGYTLVSPQLYNSKLQFVPQNRERYFLMGIRKDLNKSFVFPQQQTDFIPKLSTILESNVDEKYYIDDLKAAKIIEQAMEGLKVRQATKKGYDIAVEGDSINISHPNSKTRRGRVGKQVAQTLLTGTEQVVVEPTIKVLGHLDKPNWRDQWKRVYATDGISPTLVCNGGGHHEPKILCVGNTNPSGNGMNGKVYDSEGLAPTVTTNKGEGHKVLTEYRIRKLTPREYARLQGFPDSYEQVVSNSQFYKQMGNAVTVNVSYFIAKAIKEQL